MAISEQQFQNLWRNYGAQVRAVIARSRLLDPTGSAEDIEQEVKIKLWRLLSGETELEHTASYIRKVTNSVIIDAIRRSQARENSRRDQGIQVEQLLESDLLGTSTVEQATEHTQLESLVVQALQRLTENKRRATALRLQNMTIKEIARLTGWPTPKTRNLVYRGLADLRRELKQRGIEVEDN